MINLVASRVLTETESVEAKGKGIWFCVFCYNAQSNVAIDYVTGESGLTESYTPTAESN